MSDIEYLKDINGLVRKSIFCIEKERAAKIHEHQRRERKEELYSCHMSKHKVM